MNPSDITIVTAIDGGYIDKLLATYDTWAYFKPEIKMMPMVVIHDAKELVPHGRRMKRLSQKAKDHPDFRFVAFDGDFDSQREKMLTALTFATDYVSTPWYLKIDADTVATRKANWIKNEWFEEQDGELPSFVTNHWNYTKPAAFLDRLDDWGDTVPALSQYPRLNIEHDPGARRAYHSRIISWLFFGQTQWTREMVGLLPTHKLPVPSQDTFLWYCAARTDHRYVTQKMRRFGWGHMGRTKTSTIASTCRSLLNDN